MGYLTTFTVYNDGVDLVKTHAQDFAEKVYDAAVGHDVCDLRVGNFSNLVKVQKCRHADDHTTYVHMGNSLFEMNPYSEETRKLLRSSPNFFKKMLNFLESQVSDLKTIMELRE